MRIAIPAEGADLTTPISLRFSRCRFFIFVEPDSGRFEALPNPAFGLLEDAGIQAAQFVAAQGAQAVIAVMIGEHTEQFLHEVGITIYQAELPSGQQMVDGLQGGRLPIRTNPLESIRKAQEKNA